MRVLITLPVKVGFDGMTKQVLSYSQYMDKEDVEMDLLSCRGFDTKMEKLVEDANFNNVYRIECRDTNQIKYFLKLLKLIIKRKYDVIHANGQSATLAVEMLAGLIGGCKLRISHSHNSSCQHMKIHRLLLPLFKAAYNDAIACSKEAGAWLFGHNKYWILGNGINVDQFAFNLKKRDSFRRELGLGANEIAVGNVAAFEPHKNHVLLLDIFDKICKENNDYKFFLWGIDGTTKEWVINEIEKRELKGKVVYMGTTNHIWDYLNAMDMMLLPSLYEGFPVTVVEWQANGLPCLVSNTVTKDCNITGLVEFIPIDEGSEKWIDAILKKDLGLDRRQNEDYKKILKNKGYDIVQNANDLRMHYLDKLSRKG